MVINLSSPGKSSSAVLASGSVKTVAASSNQAPCFLKLISFFESSQLIIIDPLIYKYYVCTYYVNMPIKEISESPGMASEGLLPPGDYAGILEISRVFRWQCYFLVERSATSMDKVSTASLAYAKARSASLIE